MASGNARLRATTRTLIDGHWSNGGALYFSAVSAWEISSLIDRKRVDLTLSALEWVEEFISHPGIEAVTLDWRAAARSYNLSGELHHDPADRFLIASAIEMDCPLVTYDVKIIEFARQHGDENGFVVAVE